MNHYKIAIIGSGIVGLTAALSIARSIPRNLPDGSVAMDCVLIAPDKPEPDGRTSALLADTVDFLKALDIWDATSVFAFPLKTMRIIDGTNRLIRAPQTDFNASEIGREAFGYNVENKKLGALIETKLEELATIGRINQAVDSIAEATDENGLHCYRITTTNRQEITAEIIIAADGRQSVARQMTGIGNRKWDYPQIALVGNFTHSLPHHDTSTEFHTETGPCTLVPLGKNRSSLVWVVDRKSADLLTALEVGEFNLHLETKMQSILGKVTLEAKLKSFPLSAMIAKRFASGGILFAGEAAHVFPPIGAQGLNLGLRDVKKALELVEDFMNSEGKITPEAVGNAYHAARAGDIITRTTSVDLLNRSLLSDFLPIQAARSLGLYTLGALGPLRRLLMKEGIAPGLSRNPERQIGPNVVKNAGLENPAKALFARMAKTSGK